MKFKLEEHIVDLEQPLRVRVICEAEKALGFSMSDSDTSRVAVYIFATLRKEDPERSAVLIADEVMDMDITRIEEVEAGPPAAGPAANGAGQENQPTSGHPHSAVSA